MKKLPTILYFFVIAILLTSPVYAIKTTYSNEWQKRLKSYEKLSENKIDVANIAIELAQEIFPSLDEKHYRSTLNTMVKEVKKLIGGRTDPEYRVRALNTYLFKIKGYKYDISDPLGKKLENRFLLGILEKGKGGCVSLPLIYIILAQKLKFPVYAVSVPDHFFVRYVDSNLKRQNIETTNGGGFSSDRRYIRDFKIPKIAIEKGGYLRSMTHREFIGDLLMQNAVFWSRKGDLTRTLAYAQVILKLNPLSPISYDFLGWVYSKLTKYAMDRAADEASLPIKNARKFADIEMLKSGMYRHNSVKFRKKAIAMGLVNLPRDEYIKNMLTQRDQKRRMSLRNLVY